MIHLVEHFYGRFVTIFEHVQISALTLGFIQHKAQKATLLMEKKCCI
ncbi:hypothetical protein KKA17_02590 [bacterium]|nr:hypothetical protein [bacterium]